MSVCYDWHPSRNKGLPAAGRGEFNWDSVPPSTAGSRPPISPVPVKNGTSPHLPIAPATRWSASSKRQGQACGSTVRSGARSWHSPRPDKSMPCWSPNSRDGSVALSGGPKQVGAVLSPLPFREHRLWPTPFLPSERTNPSSSTLFIANATDPPDWSSLVPNAGSWWDILPPDVSLQGAPCRSESSALNPDSPDELGRQDTLCMDPIGIQ